MIDRLNGSDGLSWDTITIPIFIPAGASEVKVQPLSNKHKTAGKPDSFTWVVAALVPTGGGVTFSGRATVIRASVLGLINLNLVDTGPLPASGGMLEETLVTLNVPGVLSSGTASASTMSDVNQSNSQATIENLNLSLAGIGISAKAIEAAATAECDEDGNASVSGNSQILGLAINGQAIVVTGQPNQTIPLPLGLGTVIINEQKSSTDEGTGEITVNAIHVTVSVLGNQIVNIVVSSAHADIGGCE